MYTDKIDARINMTIIKTLTLPIMPIIDCMGACLQVFYTNVLRTVEHVILLFCRRPMVRQEQYFIQKTYITNNADNEGDY